MANINFSDPELVGSEIVGTETLGAYGIMGRAMARMATNVKEQAAANAAEERAILNANNVARSMSKLEAEMQQAAVSKNLAVLKHKILIAEKKAKFPAVPMSENARQIIVGAIESLKNSIVSANHAVTALMAEEQQKKELDRQARIMFPDEKKESVRDKTRRLATKFLSPTKRREKEREAKREKYLRHVAQMQAQHAAQQQEQQAAETEKGGGAGILIPLAAAGVGAFLLMKG